MKQKVDDNVEEEEESFLKCFIILSLSFVLLSVAVSNRLEVEKSIFEEVQKLNVTPYMNQSLLVFNRVPKVKTIL